MYAGDQEKENFFFALRKNVKFCRTENNEIMSAGGRLDIEIQVLRILQNSSEFKFCES
jgi:hypothetical protein